MAFGTVEVRRFVRSNMVLPPSDVESGTVLPLRSVLWGAAVLSRVQDYFAAVLSVVWLRRVVPVPA